LIRLRHSVTIALKTLSSIGLGFFVVSCGLGYVPDDGEGPRTVVEDPAGETYRPTPEQAFGLIARHEAAGFAGIRWPPGGPLTVFVTEEGDAEAAVDAALGFIERSAEPDTPPLPDPEDVVVKRVRYDADQLWAWSSTLRAHWDPLRGNPWLPGLTYIRTHWDANRIVVAVEPRFASSAREAIERRPPSRDILPDAWELQEGAPAELPDWVPPPPPYPLTDIPWEILEDPAFQCPVPGDRVAEAPRDSLDFSLEVLTTRPTLDGPVRFRAAMRNHTSSAFRISVGVGFHVAIRDSLGAGIGTAPSWLSPTPPIHYGPRLALCPRQRHVETPVWDPGEPAEEPAPGRYQAELWLDAHPETLEELDSTWFRLEGAPDR